MQAKTKIKHMILADAGIELDDKVDDLIVNSKFEELEEYINEVWETQQYDSGVKDQIYYEFRQGLILPGIDIPDEYGYSYYEMRSVGCQYYDNSWVGWIYYYGGGKHGEPEFIEWIDNSYDLIVEEKQVLKTVMTFTKK